MWLRKKKTCSAFISALLVAVLSAKSIVLYFPAIVNISDTSPDNTTMDIDSFTSAFVDKPRRATFRLWTLPDRARALFTCDETKEIRRTGEKFAISIVNERRSQSRFFQSKEQSNILLILVRSFSGQTEETRSSRYLSFYLLIIVATALKNESWRIVFNDSTLGVDEKQNKIEVGVDVFRSRYLWKETRNRTRRMDGRFAKKRSALLHSLFGTFKWQVQIGSEVTGERMLSEKIYKML